VNTAPPEPRPEPDNFDQEDEMASDNNLRLRPGALVVLEGLDRSGKSTQMDALRALQWTDPAPAFTHMPSGLTELTDEIYRLTEQAPITSPLARQLLHLACHAENIDALARARQHGGVVLDRWWWSTVAYGWYAGGLAAAGVAEALFFGMIDTVWSRQEADAIFLFVTPHEHDELNGDAVRAGYARLATQFAPITVEVPPTDPGSTTDFVITSLRERGLLHSQAS
jgi:dTMP kinase